MDQVEQVQPLSMGWCLDCHRAPAKHLRPLDQITNLAWKPPADEKAADELANYLANDKYHIRDPHYMTSCSTCHR